MKQNETKRLKIKKCPGQKTGRGMAIHSNNIFSRPDYTVGIGISPIQSDKSDSRALTAGRELHLCSPCPEELILSYDNQD